MAEYAVNITEQNIADAVSHIGLATKESFTRAVAFACLEPVNVTNDGDAYPTMFRENKKIKAQYLMGVLATMLRIPFTSQKMADGEELVGCMNEAEYDAWSESPVINQLERLKKSKNSAVVNKLFDMLYDYKAIEMMLTSAIRDELEVRNDPLNRLLQWLTMEVSDVGVKEIIGAAVRETVQGKEES